jgi:hypothetical protein
MSVVLKIYMEGDSSGVFYTSRPNPPTLEQARLDAAWIAREGYWHLNRLFFPPLRIRSIFIDDEPEET